MNQWISPRWTRRGMMAAWAIATAVASLSPQAYAQSQFDDSRLLHEGLTYARVEVDVAAAELGRLKELKVKMGDRVRQGDTLASLENEVQAASLEIAKLQAQMSGEIESAAAAMKMQRIKWDRLQQVADAAAVRPDELARAESEYEIADARHRTAVEQQRLRRAEVQRHEINLARRAIIAPVNGVIVEVYHQPGEYVTPSQPAIVRLMDDRVIQATFAIPAREIASIDVGDACQIYLVSIESGVRATISRISPEIDGESSTVRVEVDIPNPDGKYRVGDRCTMEIIRKPQRIESF